MIEGPKLSYFTIVGPNLQNNKNKRIKSTTKYFFYKKNYLHDLLYIEPYYSI
jgi:hypothetical protein